MREHSHNYIEHCIKIGVLTEDKIRKYPLRNANLAMVLKAYAVATNKPYTLSHHYEVLSDYKLYLTDGGFDWLLDVFARHTLRFLRSAFMFVFSNANEKDIYDREYIGYNNFRGITGDKPKAGTKQKAVLVHTVGITSKEYPFDTLREAREEVFDLLRFYPVEQFTLYRIRKNTKKGKVYYYRSKVPLFNEPNKRGAKSNLPNVRGN